MHLNPISSHSTTYPPPPNNHQPLYQTTYSYRPLAPAVSATYHLVHCERSMPVSARHVLVAVRIST